MDWSGKAVRALCRWLSPWTQRMGFVLSPIHYYFPIPDTRTLARRGVWDRRTALGGIDWNEKGQQRAVQLLSRFGGECRWPPSRQQRPAVYASDAPTFGYASAMFCHSMIRFAQPRRVIEIGSGWSSLLILEALRRNAGEGGKRGRYLGVDPYPPDWLKVAPSEGRLIRREVQELPVGPFQRLRANDILFIDSSHVLAPGSDVGFLFLEVLPSLPPGVLVHVHDIYLPREYPREHAERQRWFWNEQYLLQAFLQWNSEFEILLAGHWLCSERAEWLTEAFPYYNPKLHEPTGSFWMRRKIKR